MKIIIEKFDQYLGHHGLHFQTTIIGGAALISLGIIARTTEDIDCLFPEIPDEIKQASRDFALENPEYELIENWLNNGPISLANDLPEDWQKRLVTIYDGKSIFLTTLGRMDLLRTKLFALCDRQEDLADCVALAPTTEELDTCLPWVIDRDGNEFWPIHVKNSFIALAERIGYVYSPAD